MTKFEEEGLASTQWLLEISDGFSSLPVMLSRDLNGLVESKRLRLRTIMEIKEHVCKEAWGFRVVIIKSVTATGQCTNVIGHPKHLDVSGGTDQSEMHVSEVLAWKPLGTGTVYTDDDGESVESFDSGNLVTAEGGQLKQHSTKDTQVGEESSDDGSIGDVPGLQNREG
ncbi:hypothetical protein CALCODRAFT_546288 [Calocera cornea HHB12733]|uniref:Replication factor-A protein 1 N-terminal domain-containing protein n=1 Tax=Calocera cornea HHB12733 TaxID=1353952 RepID=A0A165EQ77_9BASI|nr:hypothetical protein CALCODRAFT_546288 [Calocera cornea HHB12733]